MPQSNSAEKRAFLILLLLLIAGGIYVLYPFLKTILLALILVVIFYPLHEKFLKLTRNRCGLAAALSLLSVILFIFIPIAILLTLVTSQVAELINHFQGSLSKQGLQTLLTQWYQFLEPWVVKAQNFLGVKFNLVSLLVEGMQRFAHLVAQYSPAVVTGTASFFFHLFILLIVLFYLFRDGEAFFKNLLLISPVKDQYEMNLAHEIKQTIYGIFYGSFLTSLIQSALATVGYYIAGIEGVLVWGMITFFVSFIPVIGTAGVILPLVLMLLFQGKTGHAIFLIVYGAVVIGSADNFLKPVLIRSNMHQVFLFLSLFGGMAVFGPAGLMLGPILMALLTATIKIYAKDFRASY